MGSNIDTIINQIIDDAKKKVTADVKIINQKAKNDFVNKATEAILLYYSNYKPDIYQRTYNLQDNVLNKSTNAWVQFNPRYMEYYADGGDKSIVVQNFMRGVHGDPSIKVDPDSPAELMSKFQNNYKKTLDSYFKKLGYKVN